MAKRVKVYGTKGSEFGVLSELKKIKKINGQIRTVTLEIEPNLPLGGDTTADEYGTYVDAMQDYRFSDGTGNAGDAIKTNPAIRKSIDNMVSGKRRPEAELDAISIEMAKEVVWDVLEFIAEGGNHVYQPWKGTSSENLQETGTLFDSVVARVTKGKSANKGKGGATIFYGR